MPPRSMGFLFVKRVNDLSFVFVRVISWIVHVVAEETIHAHHTKQLERGPLYLIRGS